MKRKIAIAILSKTSSFWKMIFRECNKTYKISYCLLFDPNAVALATYIFSLLCRQSSLHRLHILVKQEMFVKHAFPIINMSECVCNVDYLKRQMWRNGLFHKWQFNVGSKKEDTFDGYWYIEKTAFPCVRIRTRTRMMIRSA